LQRESLLVFWDFFADFSTYRVHVTALQAALACRPVCRSW
jgi:hypothetical protein